MLRTAALLFVQVTGSDPAEPATTTDTPAVLPAVEVDPPGLFDASTPFLERVVLGNATQDWLIALAIFAGLVVVLGIVKRVVLARLSKLAERTETDIDDLFIDLVRRTTRLYLVALAARAALHWLRFPPLVEEWLNKGIILASWLQVGLWGMGLVAYALKKINAGKSADDPARTMGGSILEWIGTAVVWTGVALLALSNLDVDVTALLTGLGVGGIAVALALQNVLGDLFASITIVLDKPFVIGDGITLGEFSGTVEHIGIKTTRLRSPDGELIVVGNSDLVNSRIRNFKRLNERRSLFTVGVAYTTPADKLEQVPATIEAIVRATPKTRFDRAHFKNFGDWSLVFEVVYFVTDPDYAAFVAAQQRINLEIVRRFAALGIEIATPTQTVIQRQMPGPVTVTDAPIKK